MTTCPTCWATQPPGRRTCARCGADMTAPGPQQSGGPGPSPYGRPGPGGPPPRAPQGPGPQGAPQGPGPSYGPPQGPPAQNQQPYGYQRQQPVGPPAPGPRWDAPGPPVAPGGPDRRRGGGGGRGLSVAIAVVAVVVVGAVLAGGVFLLGDSQREPRADPTATPTETEPTEFEDFADVYESVSSGVGEVQIRRCTGGGTGTAFLVEEDLAVTAYHVIDQATAIELDFDGTTVEGTVVAASEDDDLALVELSEPVSDGHVFELAGEVPVTGTRIAAIGFPLGSPKTLTEGTVSGLDREIVVSGKRYTGLIQTDTAINPGNSGGPMLDIEGNVVGVADAGRLDAQGISFVVPSTKVSPVTDMSQSPRPLQSCY